MMFQKLMGQEISKSLINKSLIAIKEHGVLFECTPNDGECTKKSVPFTYWVVGWVQSVIVNLQKANIMEWMTITV